DQRFDARPTKLPRPGRLTLRQLVVEQVDGNQVTRCPEIPVQGGVADRPRAGNPGEVERHRRVTELRVVVDRIRNRPPRTGAPRFKLGPLAVDAPILAGTHAAIVNVERVGYSHGSPPWSVVTPAVHEPGARRCPGL